MPRRNKSPHVVRSVTRQLAAQKTRYRNKHDAQAAADDQMRYQLDLILRVYQSPNDGGWYLTSEASGADKRQGKQSHRR
jgi:hypothetical protein